MASALHPSHSLSAHSPPFCHRTPVRDCLQAAEPCLGLGPKPDNLTVIHSKLIKHLQRCHDVEGALFISVLHHQHAGRPRYARGVSIYLCKWDSSTRWWAGGLTTRLVYRNYKQIFIHYGRSIMIQEVPGTEGAYKLFFCWAITHRAGSDSVVKVN